MLRIKPLCKINAVHTRKIAVLLALLLLLEAGLVWWFTRIPEARTFIPLRVVNDASIYAWSPSEAPRWFRTDVPTLAEAAYFRELIQPEIDETASAFEQQLSIMNWVRGQSEVADSIQAIPGDPITVHTKMQKGVPAQCENFASLFLAASTSMGFPHVRVWHFTTGGDWNRTGHVANEIWISELDKWVMVDPMNNAYTLVDGVPGSVLEVREMVLTGQADRLDFVVGPNSHTPPDQMENLYRETMSVVRMETSHTLLKDHYRTTWLNNLPLLAKRGFALLSGEARHIVLIDELSGEAAHRLPIRQAKMVFWAAVIDAGVIVFVGLWFTGRGFRTLLGAQGMTCK